MVALNHHLGKSNPNDLIKKDKKQFAVLAPQHLASNFKPLIGALILMEDFCICLEN